MSDNVWLFGEERACARPLAVGLFRACGDEFVTNSVPWNRTFTSRWAAGLMMTATYIWRTSPPMKSSVLSVKGLGGCTLVGHVPDVTAVRRF